MSVRARENCDTHIYVVHRRKDFSPLMEIASLRNATDACRYSIFIHVHSDYSIPLRVHVIVVKCHAAECQYLNEKYLFTMRCVCHRLAVFREMGGFLHYSHSSVIHKM